jgi:hypothetical protein
LLHARLEGVEMVGLAGLRCDFMNFVVVKI